MISESIEKLVNKEDLSYEEAYTVMNEIMSGQSSPTQNAVFLAALSDGAIVGSAIIKILEKYGRDSAPYVEDYVRDMKEAVSAAE